MNAITGKRSLLLRSLCTWYYGCGSGKHQVGVKLKQSGGQESHLLAVVAPCCCARWVQQQVQYRTFVSCGA